MVPKELIFADATRKDSALHFARKILEKNSSLLFSAETM